MRVIIYSVILCFAALNFANAQDIVYQTFKDTRIINTNSVETLQKGKLDFRVSHRFGDLAGDVGGWPTFYGLESASDVGIGFDYGLTDKFMVGIHRTKGSSDLRQNVSLTSKVKIMQQTVDDSPFNISVFGMATMSTMQGSSTEGVLNFFEKTAHRISYHAQVLLAKKFSSRFSGQLGVGWTYRNLVPSTDKNDLPNVSLAVKYNFSKSFGIILDANRSFSDIRTSENGYYMPIGFGFEWETGGGHVFQMNFTNATGLAETDYLPYTTSSWGDGQFRFGFTISRQFTLR